MAEEEHRTFCRICPCLCGLVVTTAGEQVLRVRGDPGHPVTHGYTCPKGRALPAFHHHPLRLDHARLGGRPASWDDVVADLAARITAAVDEGGPDAVGVYYGTWSWMDALGRRRAERIMSHLGSRSRYSAVTVDAIARLTVADLMGGYAGLLPTIDTDHPGLTLLLGTNPVVSHGHAGAVVDPIQALRRIAAGPGLWVADPRRTETARLATRHLPIRPGGDPALLAHLVRALLEDGTDGEYVRRHASGMTELRAAVAPWTAARAAARSGLAPADLADLVAAVRAAGRVSVVTGTGCTMAAEANVTEWLAWAAQIVTGSFERPGGAWFNPGAFARLDREGRPAVGGPTGGPGPPSRPDLSARFGERPCAALADEIESGGIRVLLVVGGNPLTSLPDANRLARAFAGLDALAVADVIESDTVALATHVLAVAGQLEREDVSWYTDRFPPVISAQRTAAVVAPGADRRTMADVFDDLGARLGLPPERDPLGVLASRLDGLDRPGVHVADPPRVRGWVVDKVLPGGRWQVAPAPLVAQLAAWGAQPPGPATLVAVPRRTARRMNSALRDVGRGGEDHEVWLHPADAAAAGIADGDAVAVSSPRASAMPAVARVTEDIVVGAASVPHGLGASNVSLLTSGAPGCVDPLTGMVIQSGFAIEIRPAPG